MQCFQYAYAAVRHPETSEVDSAPTHPDVCRAGFLLACAIARRALCSSAGKFQAT